jgi:rhodanese-related sulfurtransferase
MTKRYKEKPKNNQQTFIWGIVILAAIVLAGVWIGGQATQTSSAKTILVDEAAQKWNQGAFILDVRTVEEWEEGHIPDSTPIPLEELPDRLSEIPRDREIVVVCRTGNHSLEAQEILLDAGFEQVMSMSGGMNKWTSRGYPIETGP